MTLRQPNVERMLQLGLHGMVEVLEEQRDIADIDQLVRRDNQLETPASIRMRRGAAAAWNGGRA